MALPVMEIPWDAQGTFKKRPNRFLGIVDITKPRKVKAIGEKVHVHDPGRLKELLYQGNQVLLRKAQNANRMTKWDVIAARYEKDWVLVHSGYHREIAEWVIGNEKVSPFGKVKTVRAEVRFGESRLDFLLTRKNGKEIWVEVKGCTLAENGIALFPDAPTKRGARHLKSLISAKKRGSQSAIVILVFRKDAKCFAPNEKTDPDFSRIFHKALGIGVEVYPVLFQYEDGGIYYLKKIPICKSS